MNNLISFSLSVLLFISHFCYGQGDKKEDSSLTCDSIGIYDYDTIIIDNSIIQYKLLSKSYYETKKQKDSFNGEILMPNLPKNLDKKNIDNIFQVLMTKYDIDEIVGFRDCEARAIFYQSLKLLPQQEKYLKENLIGKFDRK